MKINYTAVFINGSAIVGLIISLIKNKQKTKKALFVAVKGIVKMIPAILMLLILVALILGFVKPDFISRFLGDQSGFLGIALASIAGAVLMIPSMIAFPLTASLVDSGASIGVAAAFITTLTMIGFVTMPLEIQELGRKYTLLRNGISFVIAVIIALVMGAVL